MDFVLKPKKREGESSINAVLIAAKGDWSGDKVSWETRVKEVPLTIQEVSRLKRAHNTNSPNIARATKVKSLMLIGLNPLQIYTQLKAYGRGYGLSSIKHDHAALSQR